MTTPTVEDIKDIILSFVQDLCFGEENKRRAVVTVSEALTIYGNARYEEGVKAESTRRDGIERAIEQSIIDQHIALEKAKIIEWAKEDVEYGARPLNDEVVRVKGRFTYSGQDADGFYHGYCSCLADLIILLTNK